MIRDHQDGTIKAYLEDGIGRVPITKHVNQETIMLRVQSRRRNRAITAGVGTLALALIATGAFAAVGGGRHSRDRQPVTPAAVSPARGFVAPKALTRCGAQLPGTLSSNRSPLAIEMTAPASIGGGQDFHASAVITNVSDQAVTAVGAAQPYASVVAAGVVKMLQGPGRMSGAILQLKPGESRTFDLTLVAGACASEAVGMSPQDYARQHPLPAGGYLVYGAYSFQIDQQPVQTIASAGHEVSVN